MLNIFLSTGIASALNISNCLFIVELMWACSGYCSFNCC